MRKEFIMQKEVFQLGTDPTQLFINTLKTKDVVFQLYNEFGTGIDAQVDVTDSTIEVRFADTAPIEEGNYLVVIG